ncbi:Hypothetical protein PFR_JS14_1765 [Propionibacterium freudenreichii]|nr:Hypothetical protein PFR_JS14_1765 [Propionibacterium freudenreichii]
MVVVDAAEAIWIRPRKGQPDLSEEEIEDRIRRTNAVTAEVFGPRFAARNRLRRPGRPNGDV